MARLRLPRGMLGAQAPSPYLSARVGTRPPPPPESDSAKAAEEINRWLGVAEGIVTSPVTDLIIQGGLWAGRGGKQEGKWEGTPEQRVARQRAAVGAQGRDPYDMRTSAAQPWDGYRARRADARADVDSERARANPFARGGAGLSGGSISDRGIMRRRAMDALNWLRGTDGPEPGVGDPGGALKAATAAAARRLGGMDPPADARDPHRPPEQAERPGAGTFSRDAMLLQTAWEQYHKTRQGPQPLAPSPYRASYWSQMPSDADEIFYIAHQGGSTNDLKRIMRALEAAPDLGPRNLSDLLAGTNDRLLGAKREALLAFMARNKQMSSTGDMESSRAMAEIYGKVMKGRKAGVEAKKIEDREARRGQGGGRPPPARKPKEDADVRAYFAARDTPSGQRSAEQEEVISIGNAGGYDKAYAKLTEKEIRDLATGRSKISPVELSNLITGRVMSLQDARAAAAAAAAEDAAARKERAAAAAKEHDIFMAAYKRDLDADEAAHGRTNRTARTLIATLERNRKRINDASLNGEDVDALLEKETNLQGQLTSVLRDLVTEGGPEGWVD